MSPTFLFFGGIPMAMSMWVVLEHGQIPERLDSVYGVGKSLAGFLDGLDATARDLGLSPLGGFVVDYAERTEELFGDEDVEIDDIEAAIGNLGSVGPWYDPDDGLRTAHGLIQHFQGLLEREDGRVQRRGPGEPALPRHGA